MLYQAVVEQAAEGILLVDVSTKRVLDANTAYQGLLGYSPEEMSYRTLYDLVLLQGRYGQLLRTNGGPEQVR